MTSAPCPAADDEAVARGDNADHGDRFDGSLPGRWAGLVFARLKERSRYRRDLLRHDPSLSQGVATPRKGEKPFAKLPGQAEAFGFGVPRALPSSFISCLRALSLKGRRRSETRYGQRR